MQYEQFLNPEFQVITCEDHIINKKGERERATNIV